jgi:hypothetical protein
MSDCSIETSAALPLARLAAQKSASLHDHMLNLSAFLKAFTNRLASSRDKKQGP